MLWRRGFGLAAAMAAAVAWGGSAYAHDLRCEKTVNDKSVVWVDDYPTTVHYAIKVWNANPVVASTALSVVDSLLSPLGFTFSPNPPFTLGVNEEVIDTEHLTIDSYEHCQELAESDDSTKVYLDNVVTVTWNEGSGVCSARVVCKPECEDCDEGGATRTMGFFKTHEASLAACLAEGSIDLGYITITTLEEALGLLWGSPSKYDGGGKRSELDKARFLLARQTLVGICNFRLFDTVPDPATLLTDAVAALGGTDCDDIKDLVDDVDDYNNSGDDVDFPAGFEPGPATPKHASSIADDPTSPSGASCQ